MEFLTAFSKTAWRKEKLCNGCYDTDDEDATHQLSKIMLTQKRVIMLHEQIDKKTSDTVMALLLYYKSVSQDEVTIHIDSPGGDAFALVNMIDMIRYTRLPVKTVCVGQAASAGALLLASGTKGRRYAVKNSQIMIHGLQCTFPISDNIHESNEYSKHLKKSNEAILGMLADNVGKDKATVLEDCKRDVYLTADEALKYGIIDHIVTKMDQLY